MSLAAHRHRLRLLLPLAVAVLAALVPVLSLSLATPVRAVTHAVGVFDGSFSPATLTITAGDTVTWTNEDDSPHTVTAAGGAFDSGNLDVGGSFTFTFTEPGTYPYVCAYHDEMQATIVVEPASGPAPAAPAHAPASASQPAGDTQGATAASATHAAGHGGGQPNTAVPLPADFAGWLAPLLIGLGLVAFAFGLVPMARPRQEEVAARSIGWRR
jgi:plastocyanin